MSVFKIIISIAFLFQIGTFGQSHASSMNAQEILQQVIKNNFSESIRIPLTIETTKGKKTTKHVLWMMSRTKGDLTDFFIEFDEPKDSKGLRFLFKIKPNESPKAYMYLPAAQKTLPLGMDDPSVDLGGTGLTMEDVQGFMPKGGEREELVREEKVDGHDTYVIRVTLPDNLGERLLWITKKDFLVIKSQSLDNQGKVKRQFRVVEFFRTEQGREFPREEEVTIPDKQIKVKIRQDNAVMGSEIPDELMNPETFGTHNWKG